MKYKECQYLKKKKNNELPDWIEEDTTYLIDFDFSMRKDCPSEVFEAVKNSTLPQEIVEYLITEKDLEGMLVAVGFEFAEHQSELLIPCRYKPLLGHHTFSFMEAIAPFVSQNSYLEFRGEALYRWVFKDSKCYEVEPEIIWNY